MQFLKWTSILLLCMLVEGIAANLETTPVESTDANENSAYQQQRAEGERKGANDDKVGDVVPKSVDTAPEMDGKNDAYENKEIVAKGDTEDEDEVVEAGNGGRGGVETEMVDSVDQNDDMMKREEEGRAEGGPREIQEEQKEIEAKSMDYERERNAQEFGEEEPEAKKPEVEGAFEAENKREMERVSPDFDENEPTENEEEQVEDVMQNKVEEAAVNVAEEIAHQEPSHKEKAVLAEKVHQQAEEKRQKDEKHHKLGGEGSESKKVKDEEHHGKESGKKIEKQNSLVKEAKIEKQHSIKEGTRENEQEQQRVIKVLEEVVVNANKDKGLIKSDSKIKNKKMEKDVENEFVDIAKEAHKAIAAEKAGNGPDAQTHIHNIDNEFHKINTQLKSDHSSDKDATKIKVEKNVEEEEKKLKEIEGQTNGATVGGTAETVKGLDKVHSELGAEISTAKHNHEMDLVKNLEEVDKIVVEVKKDIEHKAPVANEESKLEKVKSIIQHEINEETKKKGPENKKELEALKQTEKEVVHLEEDVKHKKSNAEKKSKGFLDKGKEILGGMKEFLGKHLPCIGSSCKEDKKHPKDTKKSP